MILREAVEVDFAPLAALATKMARQLDAFVEVYPPRSFKKSKEQGIRTMVLYEEGVLVAALSAKRRLSYRGPTAEVSLLLIDQEHPDRTRLMDAICLYALNVAVNEGYHVIESRNARPAERYAQEMLGMDVEPSGVDSSTGKVSELTQRGDAQTIVKTILRRRPEWRISL